MTIRDGIISCDCERCTAKFVAEERSPSYTRLKNIRLASDDELRHYAYKSASWLANPNYRNGCEDFCSDLCMAEECYHPDKPHIPRFR